MVKLLISVKNKQEALDALQAGADFIDLKDPSVGALGELNLADTTEIFNGLSSQTITSVTIGEKFENKTDVLDKVREKLALGAHVVKLPVTLIAQLALDEDLKALVSETDGHLVGVIFADSALNLSWIRRLSGIGFYGVMLDTQLKHHALPMCISSQMIDDFVKECELYRLQSGLAGALRVEYLDSLIALRPTYVGFRSGVCLLNDRKNTLLPQKVKEIKDKLRKHNSFCVKIEV